MTASSDIQGYVMRKVRFRFPTRLFVSWLPGRGWVVFVAIPERRR